MKTSLSILLASILLACATPARAPEPARARAGLTEMHAALDDVAHACTRASRARQDDALFDRCVKTLIPARDAVHFADEAANPWWSPRAGRKIACAGASTEAALTTLCQSLTCDEQVRDALIISHELAANADTFCDPLHPTVEVSFTEDADIPRVEPNYPSIVR